ncbi:hypothetical protein [Nitratireductor sp. ZSWI3]|uniref:hypothetical protein n=1 Tax=Nitratireductor sp. ZSWI3 TaxID=2966359 RepID=UPI0021502E5B|nr:hypothetical protein [Nitratireductor sp. ZSWI3]MCR4264691.1 hypothetical protein [Nitratireductor sp. ZSWI3]
MTRLIKEAADHLEQRSTPENLQHTQDICREIRAIARSLEADVEHELPPEVARLVDLCAEIVSENLAPGEADEHEHPAATHLAPQAPGGLGYMMTLSEEEEGVVVSQPHNPSPIVDEDTET